MGARDFCWHANEELELLYVKLTRSYEFEQRMLNKTQNSYEEFFDHELKALFRNLKTVLESSQYLVGDVAFDGTIHQHEDGEYYIDTAKESILLRPEQELEYLKIATDDKGHTAETWRHGKFIHYNKDDKPYIASSEPLIGLANTIVTESEKNIEGLTVRVRVPRPMEPDTVSILQEERLKICMAGVDALEKQGKE